MPPNLLSSENPRILGVAKFIQIGDYRYTAGVFKGQTSGERVIAVVRHLQDSQAPVAETECVPVDEFPPEIVELLERRFPGARLPGSSDENRDYARTYLL